MSIFSSKKLPSERTFGLVMAAAFALLGVRGFFKHWSAPRCLASGAVSIGFIVLALAMPRVLVPLNRAWFHLGHWMGKIISPIVLGIIFFGILTPISLLTRLFGRDVLCLKRRDTNSYWVDRVSGDLARESFKNQY
jgi:tetrahydromethanopterin S-methyltransferase subunit C